MCYHMTDSLKLVESVSSNLHIQDFMRAVVRRLRAGVREDEAVYKRFALLVSGQSSDFPRRIIVNLALFISQQRHLLKDRNDASLVGPRNSNDNNNNNDSDSDSDEHGNGGGGGGGGGGGDDYWGDADMTLEDLVQVRKDDRPGYEA